MKTINEVSMNIESKLKEFPLVSKIHHEFKGAQIYSTLRYFERNQWLLFRGSN